MATMGAGTKICCLIWPQETKQPFPTPGLRRAALHARDKTVITPETFLTVTAPSSRGCVRPVPVSVDNCALWLYLYYHPYLPHAAKVRNGPSFLRFYSGHFAPFMFMVIVRRPALVSPTVNE